MSFNPDDYEPVAARLDRWLKEHPDGQVLTEMLTEPGADVCVFKTTLMISGVLVATGHAEEVRGQGNVNRTSHVENCETSSTGRALANAGVAGSDWTKRASREEMSKVVRQTTSNGAPGHENTVVTSFTMTGQISEKQAGYIRGAFKREGNLAPADLDHWSKQDASNWIDAHKNGVQPSACPRPLVTEEPF